MGAVRDVDTKKLFDVIVVGGGPAGLAAALYLARARYRVLVVERDRFGGQITITSEVVNYPGVFKASGKELTEAMRSQAERFGAEFLLAEVVSLDMDGDVKTVRTSAGDYHSFGVLLATGARPRKVGFAGEEEHQGRGVAYCATCDGEFFTGKDVFVIGGGFAAAEESVFLTKFARSVTIMMRGADFTCAPAASEEARHHDKIRIMPHTVVEEVAGEAGLTYLRYRNTETGEVTEFHAKDGETFGVFVFAGYSPVADLIADIADLDERGYVITDASQKTSVDGLYAAGDVCIKPLRQVVTAVSDGALAATELERYCAAMQAETGLQPQVPATAKAASASSGQSAETPASKPAAQSALFDEAMQAQLNAMFDRMERPLVLELTLDDRPVSMELEGYMNELADLTDKLSVRIAERSGGADAPRVRVCLEDGTWTGLSFHGVPGGHEFTSFVLGLYNAAGPGQQLDEATRSAIAAIGDPTDMMVLISLSCTMCPDLVVAAQRIAAENPNVQTRVFDINHFPELRERYNVMSVPCLVLNESRVSFGKKNITQLLDLIEAR